MLETVWQVWDSGWEWRDGAWRSRDVGWEIGKMGFGGFDVGKLLNFLGFVTSPLYPLSTREGEKRDDFS